MLKPEDVEFLDADEESQIQRMIKFVDDELRTTRGDARVDFDDINRVRTAREVARRYEEAGWAVAIGRADDRFVVEVRHPKLAAYQRLDVIKEHQPTNGSLPFKDPERGTS